VVTPPLSGVAGSWQCDAEGRDVRARFVDANGQLHGFALTGAAVAEKLQLTRELPAWLG
jgi:rubredoxin-NAD+ reductase